MRVSASFSIHAWALDLSKFWTFWKSYGYCGFSRAFDHKTELAKIFFDSDNDFALPKGPKDFPIKARRNRGFPYFCAVLNATSMWISR